MRILLVAYDFPPIKTPRALRWRYLARELVLQGHEVHVLMPDLGPTDVVFPDGPGHLQVHCTWPGPYGWLQRRANRAHLAGGPGVPVRQGRAMAMLNWRGRLVDAAKKACGMFMYPDIRAEWMPWARRKLRQLLPVVRPDVVVTSHEPATTLPLGRSAQHQGFPWVADLGDPVCAPYTPKRWQRRALRLEAMVSRHADTVVVTTEATRQLLVARHGQDPTRCVVLPNGYDDRRSPAAAGTARLTFDEHRLELIHAGRLYDYRDPSGLLQATTATQGVRLTLVLPDPPEGHVGRLIEAAGENVRVIGSMPHDAVMCLLEAADVLVNIGDVGGSVQIPAKLYEYLGLERPILHVVTGPGDGVARMLQPLGRGWIRGDDPHQLGEFLQDLRNRKLEARLHRGLSLAPMIDHAHSTLGRRLSDMLEGLAQARGQSLDAADPP